MEGSVGFSFPTYWLPPSCALEECNSRSPFGFLQALANDWFFLAEYPLVCVAIASTSLTRLCHSRKGSCRNVLNPQKQTGRAHVSCRLKESPGVWHGLPPATAETNQSQT